MADDARYLSVSDAGAKINALLDAEAPAKPKAPKAAKVATAPKAEVEPDPYRPEEEKPKDEPDEEKEKEEEPKDAPEASDEDEDEEAPVPEVRKLKVKVDGQEQEIDEAEVVKGYSRTADYTRKTQALAEERKKFDAEEREPLRQERQYYAETVARLEEAMEALMPTREPDWAVERTRLTPEEFTEAFATFQANRQRMEKVRGEKASVLEKMDHEENRRLRATLKQEQEKLLVAMPEMADEEKGKALKDDLIAYAKSLSYTDDDIDQVTDHRALVLLDKARRWDELQRRKPKIEDKIDRALESIKPSAAKSKPRTSDLERAKGRLAVSGRLDDAASVLNAMFKDKP